MTQAPGGSPCFTNHEIEAQRGKVVCPGPVQSSGLTGTTAFPHEESESGPPPAPLPSHRFGSLFTRLGWEWGARSASHATATPLTAQDDPSLDPGLALFLRFYLFIY